nr:retrovirus-related Pol polyprotein from transposon TNT 1-94 [Tanacetum cinerariifolium]
MTKQIRRTAQITKSERTIVATSPSPNIDSNTLVLSSIGVTLVSSASGSKSQDNTKKNRIRRTQKKAKKTELEDHLRTVKSSLNKASVVDTKTTSSVIKSVSNVNSNLKCTSCNGCLFSDNHDACVVEYINSMNASKKSKSVKTPVKRKIVHIVLWYLDSGCLKHMTGDRSQLINFVQKFLGMVKFGNDHVAKIMGYGDYQIGNVIISRVYYMEGLGHNLFSVGQFCDLDLEVPFCQHTCFKRNLDGVDLLTGSRGNNLYTLSLKDMLASSPICLLSKASKTKSWLWHPCAMGKSTKKTHKPKSEDTNQEKLYLLQMDLCGPMRVESVDGKKYILVIVDDYSRFTWVKFLRSKDETLMFIIKFLKMIQVVQIVLWYLDFGCSKHMTGDRSQLVNFVQKFLGTVKFGNDHVEKIMGYGDYQIGSVTIFRVYYVEGLGHNLFSIGQFCDSDLEVAFRQHTCFKRNLDFCPRHQA